MNYQEVKDYLYKRLAFFQRDGASAFKKDLSKTIAFLSYLKNPQERFKAIHIAGTNGKGSSAHSIAAVLQSAGYKTGLYTSPHLLDFNERIRLNGVPVEERYVVDFVMRHKEYIEKAKPSFFEVTVVLAFQYFADEQVDIAVVETGMGGRLDSTNLVDPMVCLITNIGLDHQQYLGDTLREIANEKAGIIKQAVPVVIGEYQGLIADIFETTAKHNNSSCQFASEAYEVKINGANGEGQVVDVFLKGDEYLVDLRLDILSRYYIKNLPGILSVLNEVSKIGYKVSAESIRDGLSSVKRLTGLLGRWQKLEGKALAFCDVGHNVDGIKEVLNQIKQYEFDELHIVYGTVNDKELKPVIKLLPKDAVYYLCRPNIARGLDTALLAEEFEQNHLIYNVFDSVSSAVDTAMDTVTESDFLFIGGSTFVVAEIPELID